MLRGPPRKASDSTYRSIERIRKPDCSTKPDDTMSTVDARALALRASPADVQSYSRYLARIFKMKKLITTLAMATTLIAAPAFAQSTTAPSRNDVTVGGKNIGQDPDSNVRLQLRRDYGSEGF
jgi:hypothetical protein